MYLTKAQTITIINNSTTAINYVATDAIQNDDVESFEEQVVQDKIDIIEICLDALRANRGVSLEDFSSLDTVVSDEMCDMYF